MKLKPTKLNQKDAVWGLLFVSVPVLSVILFVFFPALFSIYISLVEWNGFIPIEQAQFVGFKNFAAFLPNGIYAGEFRNAVFVTVVLMLSVPLHIIIAFLLAYALNRKETRLKSPLRLSYFMPFISSAVAITLVFKNLFDQNGVVNACLGLFGAEALHWLQSPGLSRVVILVMLVWRNIGYTMLLYLGGLQGISAEIYEAAKIDGAGFFQTIKNITLPALKNISFFLVVTNVISGLQIYTEPAILFQNSLGKGPMNGTETMMVFLMQSYSGNSLGLASAISWAITLLILLATFVQFLYRKRGERHA